MAMLAVHRSLEITARVSAALLFGALLCIGYFVGINRSVAFIAWPAGIALWLVTLRATRRTRMPGFVQIALVVTGFVFAGFILLVVSLSNLDMD